MKSNLICFFLIFLFSASVYAQKFEYGVEYGGLFDNREFPSGYSRSETITGSGLDFSVGTSIDSIHKFRVGLNYFYEFGTKLLEIRPNPILYYSVEKNGLGLKIGAFLRNKSFQMPLPFMSEKWAYFNPTIDGIMISYNKKDFSTGIYLDWVSRIDSLRREQFMICYNGKYNPGNFILEGYWYLFHDRPNLMRLPGDHIMDYTGANFMLGYNFKSLLPLDILTLKGGILTSLYRNRGNGLDFELSNSAYFDIAAEYKGIGLHSVMNFGDPHHFSQGDDFYSNTSNYIRADVYFTPLRYKNITGRFTWSFHVANSKLEHQQIFLLLYTLNPV